MQFSTRRKHPYPARGYLRSAAVLLCGAFIAGVANAEIYKWTDTNGVVHYGSEPPEEVPAETVNVKTGKTGTTTGQGALKQMQEAEAAEQKRIKEEGIPEQPPVPALSRQEMRQRCQQARDQLAAINARGQIRERDAQGNIRYLPEEDRQNRIRQAKQNIREYCQ